MARVVVTRDIPRRPLERLTAVGHDVHVREGETPPSREELLELVADADGLLVTLTERIDVGVLDAATKLRAIGLFGVGWDSIDVDAATARGIAVGNTPDVLTDATADLALALILATARRLPEAAESVTSGGWTTWEPLGLLGLELRGARLCVVGAGRIGRATAERAAAFGMEVDYVGRGDDLHAALGRADVVSVHAPLTNATRGLFDAATFAAMKRGAIFINTARGGLVDQVALADALRSGQLAAAGLDVTDPEPLPPTDPLLAAPNLLVLPHIGSATHATRERMAQRAVENLLSALEGQPMPWPVNPAPASPTAAP